MPELNDLWFADVNFKRILLSKNDRIVIRISLKFAIYSD